MQQLLSRARKVLKQYHWHWALLRLTVGVPILCLIWIGEAGERLCIWADELLPDARKGV